MTATAILLLLAVMLWFAVGTQRNISRGNHLLRWLQGGLPSLGRRTRLRWLGSSAVELGLVDPPSPFREVTVVVVLEPRDVAWLWALARRRGRRDFLILRARLERPPAIEVEAGDPSAWTGTDRLRGLDPDAWEELDPAGWAGLRVLRSPGAPTEPVREAFAAIGAASGGVWRLSVRREPPHLEVHVLPPDPAVGADRLVRAFVELARVAR